MRCLSSWQRQSKRAQYYIIWGNKRNFDLLLTLIQLTQDVHNNVDLRLPLHVRKVVNLTRVYSRIWRLHVAYHYRGVIGGARRRGRLNPVLVGIWNGNLSWLIVTDLKANGNKSDRSSDTYESILQREPHCPKASLCERSKHMEEWTPGFPLNNVQWLNFTQKYVTKVLSRRLCIFQSHRKLALPGGHVTV